MLHSVGHGYDNPTMPGREPCTAFQGLSVIANPLGGFSNADRERRSFNSPSGGVGVTYSSHSMQLGIREEDEDKPSHHRRHLFLMMSHGGGREVYSMRNGVHCCPVDNLLTAMPERELYALLYSIWEGQQEARRQAIAETDAKWRMALDEKRVVKRRAKGGRPATHDIMTPWELDKRARKSGDDL